jgi:hypothetical protein
MKSIALLITYTMDEPLVGGVFFRALRLANELFRRDWTAIILNSGPRLSDPKIDQAGDKIDILWNRPWEQNESVEALCAEYKRINPSVIIMGEYPFQAMERFFQAAKMTAKPLVVLDQYYNQTIVPDCEGVDLILLYGLSSFWEDDFIFDRPYVLTPPFIEQVAPKPLLPVPSHLRHLPWITLVAYEPAILLQGLQLLGDIDTRHIGIIVLSSFHEQVQRLCGEFGINPKNVVDLPLQDDANMFGFIHASRVCLVSNGFIQLMDALALGCPVIALERGYGVGMNELNIDERFFPHISFGETRHKQAGRMDAWLKAPPFTPELRKVLESERGGISLSADLIEGLTSRPHQQPVSQDPER